MINILLQILNITGITGDCHDVMFFFQCIDGNDFSGDTDDVSTFMSGTSNESLSSSDNKEEIWNVLNEEDTVERSEKSNKGTESLLLGVFLFLNFFQLFYCILERAMIALLGFLKAFLSHLANVSQNPFLSDLASVFPKSLYSIRRMFKRSDDVIEYVVCPSCSTLYLIDECIIKLSNGFESKNCNYVAFPNHPHHSKRSKCGAVLMKKVNIGGKSKLVPKKLFVYHNLVKALEALVMKPKFLQKCEHWRERAFKLPPEILADIYEGRVWKSLNFVEHRPFLALPNNLCLALNIDWFNPFDETPYSAGAIYLTVLNLPRTERYKIDNMILIGIMPGPHEPKNCNSFLAPLVTDLNVLYNGMTMKSSSNLHFIRALLVCVCCDLPATRKICGFQNFNAKMGCSKCLKQFVTDKFGSKPNYGGFDLENWLPRDTRIHISKAFESKAATTASQRNKIEQSYDAKFSELHNLPSFDIVKYHIIDPMHNIFLGLAKHTMKTWRDLDILQTSQYVLLQEKVDSVNPPTKIGRIPRKIGAGFVSFTADEWKHWILVYSTYALHEVIPENHFICWCLLVESCQLLCRPVLSTEQVQRAHSKLLEFCKMFEINYGSECCTPNMHMACHLQECVLDYVPLSSFWCFPFERYNGLLEGVKKSWNSPEKQMLQKFLGMQHIDSLSDMYAGQICAGIHDDFVSTVSKRNTDLSSAPQGSYSSFDQTTIQDVITVMQAQNVNCKVSMLDASEKPYQCLQDPLYEKCLWC